MSAVVVDESPSRSRIGFQIIAPVALFLMAVAAPIALAMLQSPETPRGLVQLALVLFVFVALMDIVVAWAFFHLFETTNRPLANLTMLLRVAYAVLLVASLSGYSAVAASPAGGAPLAELFRQFDFGWTLALLVFGVHLILLGVLILKSKFYHFVLGTLVIVSGFGYSFDSTMKMLVLENPLSISTFTFLGEVLLIGWRPINAWRLAKGTMPAPKERK